MTLERMNYKQVATHIIHHYCNQTFLTPVLPTLQNQKWNFPHKTQMGLHE